MPRSFSRKAVRRSRALTWCQNSLETVSQPSISIRWIESAVALSFAMPSITALLELSPRLALLPAPLAARALFLDAEIEFLDVFLLQQPLAGVGHDDAADLEHVAEVGGHERHVRVLLDQQDGDAELAVDALDDVEDVLHQLGAEAERGLVQQHQPGPRHQGAADGKHLLLAARQRAGALVGALAQHREIAEHRFEILGDTIRI